MKEILKQQEGELACDTEDIQRIQSKLEKLKDQLIEFFTKQIEEMKKTLFFQLNKRVLYTPQQYEKNKQMIERVGHLANAFKKNPKDVELLNELALNQYEFYRSNKSTVNSSGES